MSAPRLKTKIWVDAHLRRCQSEGAFATVARKGDPDAGAVAVKVFLGLRRARLFLQSIDIDGNKIWREPLREDKTFEGDGEGDASAQDQSADDEAAVDQRIEREVSFDPDLWVIEIEDRDGRSFLD